MTTIWLFLSFFVQIIPGWREDLSLTHNDFTTTQNLNFYSKGEKTMLENYTNGGFDNITTVSNKTNGDFCKIIVSKNSQ